jgi:RNA polymerase sigma-70 factor (ECF subfamily)
MQSSSEINLLNRLQAGEKAAFDQLFQQYYKLLCANACYFLQDEDDARELVQNLFVDLWEKKNRLQLHENLKSYLFLAVKNRCLNHLEKLKTRQKNYAAFSGLQEKMTQPAFEPVPDYITLVNGELEQMADQKKYAIRAVYLKGKSYQEAANEMGISINSLKTHLKSGLKLLRNSLKNNPTN